LANAPANAQAAATPALRAHPSTVSDSTRPGREKLCERNTDQYLALKELNPASHAKSIEPDKKVMSFSAKR
jgi:hypothetical protein